MLQGPDTQDWRSRPVSSHHQADVIDVLTGLRQRGAQPRQTARSPICPSSSTGALSRISSGQPDRTGAGPLSDPLARSSPLARGVGLDLAALEAALPLRASVQDPAPYRPDGAAKSAACAGTSCAVLVDRQPCGTCRPSAPRTASASGAARPGSSRRSSRVCPHWPLVFTTTSSTSVSGFSKAKRHLDARITDARGQAGLPPLPAWTLHDLRRTMVTMMNERLGIHRMSSRRS